MLVVAVVLVTTNPVSAAPPQSYRDVWTAVVGQTGTLTTANGGYVFTLASTGGKDNVSYVGQDYVDFGERSNVAGEKTRHVVIPMSRLIFQAQR
jgi:hypothetical protein